MKDIKVGDIVHVQGRVYDFSHQRTLLDFNMDDKCDMAWIPTSAVVHVEPRPIKVGDRVLCAGLTGTVHGVHAERAWVLWDDPDINYCSPPLLSLTRIDGEPS